jgi:hypothetical protein
MYLDPFIIVILKSRLSDGRLRVSFSFKTDLWLEHSLAEFEDKRLYKELQHYQAKIFHVTSDYYKILHQQFPKLRHYFPAISGSHPESSNGVVEGKNYHYENMSRHDFNYEKYIQHAPEENHYERQKEFDDNKPSGPALQRRYKLLRSIT